MSREVIEGVMRRAYAARVEGDLDTIMKHFTEAPHFSLAGSASASPIPLAATGASAIREVMRRLLDSFDFLEAEIVDVLVDGDRAAVQSRVLLRPVGRDEAVHTEILDIVRIEDGRIASMKQFADTALAARLLSP